MPARNRSGTVELIRAAFGDQLHLGAGRTPLIRISVRRCHAKFFNGIESRAQRACKRIPGCLVIIIDSVERQIGLVAAAAIHGATAAVTRKVHLAAIRDRYDAGLQTQNACGIPPFEWQSRNFRLVERISNRGVLRVNRLDCAADLDCGNSGRDLKMYVVRGRNTHKQVQSGVFRHGESLSSHRQNVSATADLLELINAVGPVRLTPNASLESATSAFGTTAPCGSITVPRTDAVPVWPNDPPANKTHATHTHSTLTSLSQ